MSEGLFIDAYKILNDKEKPEEDRVDAVEARVHDVFPELKPDEVERLVLDILMAHHRGKDAKEASRSQKITTRKSLPQALPVPSAGVGLVNRAQTEPTRTTQTDDALDQRTCSPSPIAPIVQTFKPFDQLRNIFGWENSDQDIERALAHNDFDLERTIKMLVGEPDETDITKEQMSARIMCRYFINGNCARGSQCMYSHDGSSRLCRFWLHDRCVAGSLCMFMHEVPPSIQVETTKPETAYNAFEDLPDLNSLPKLGQKPKPQKQKAATSITSPLPQHSTSIVRSTLGHTELRRIKDVLSSSRGLVYLAGPQLTPWKTPEFANNDRYCDLRKQASAHAEQRNRLLQQSTTAWTNNDAAQAKKLSRRGREYEEKMIQCYFEAADALWEQRKIPGSEIWVDLHGLDLMDAVCKAEECLEEVSETKFSPRAVYFVSSRGHFREKEHADTLTQYLITFLDSKGYKHKDCGADPLFGRITAVDPYSRIRS